MKLKTIASITSVAVVLIFIVVSFLVDFPAGKEITHNLGSYGLEMLRVLPVAFILIGLFEVWVKRETVQRHLGEKGGFRSYIWAIVLGGLTIGPMIVSLPVAFSLRNKGARLSVVFTYIGAAAVCRIPMTILEASYLGVLFTVIRYAVSIPLIILSSWGLGTLLEKRKFALRNGKHS